MLTNIILPECSSAALAECIVYVPGRVRFQLKILKPILPLLFIFYRGSNHNFPTTRLYYFPTNFFDISFHFIISLRVCIVSYCKYNQRSVVSALLPTSKQNSMTASRDYMISTWCLWNFLLYASRLVLRYSSASHCRMRV